MNTLKGNLAYVVGEEYASLATLSHVMTVSQFIKGALEHTLPLDWVWKMGQGLSSVEKNLLALCQAYRSDILFYTSDEKQSLPDIITLPSETQARFSKLSRLIMSIMQAGRKSISRLCVSR